LEKDHIEKQKCEMYSLIALFDLIQQ